MEKRGKRKNKSGFLEMSFGWLFALVVGAFILFMAIFFVVKFTGTEERASDAQLSKNLGILLNPLETGFVSAKVSVIELPSETRIYNECSGLGNFGKQTFRTSQKSFGEFSEDGVNVPFQNKYLLSENPVEGKRFYIFSKPFEFPFKVADLIYITSSKKDYCFVNAPNEISEEINDLKQSNFFNVTRINDCPGNSEKICFGSGSSLGTTCDVIVKEETKTVSKQEGMVKFESDALMYAAIFSSPDIYECQVSRLMNRASELANLYNEKAALVSIKNCNTNLNLPSLKNSLDSFSSSQDLNRIALIAEDIREKNEDAACKLW